MTHHRLAAASLTTVIVAALAGSWAHENAESDWPGTMLAECTASAQTKTAQPRNDYLPQEDARLGREAAEVARSQLPILNDGRVDAYVQSLGRRLVDAIPAKFRQPAFAYSFDVVNLDSLSAIALPGGPMFISRGMIEAARTEGELAGVMAHQLAHLVLRHATAQATAGQKFQVGEITGPTLGTIVAGPGGGIMAQGSSFGLSSYFFKYHPDLERQADVLAAPAMARAGWDPAHLADVFHTIEREGRGRGGPQWMSSHPNPGDRDEYIRREARSLHIEGAPVGPDGFGAIQALLRTMPPTPTAEEAARQPDSRVRPPEGVVRLPVPVPSGASLDVTAGDLIHMSVPANWLRLSRGNTVIFAPEGAFFESDGDVTAFTHGIQLGIARSLTGNLEHDTDALLEDFGQANPQLRWVPAYQRTRIGGRNGLTTALNNVSALTREFEYVSVSTVHLSDCSLLYLIGIAPQDEAGIYRNAFNRIQESIQFTD